MKSKSVFLIICNFSLSVTEISGACISRLKLANEINERAVFRGHVIKTFPCIDNHVANIPPLEVPICAFQRYPDVIHTLFRLDPDDIHSGDGGRRGT